MPHAHRPVRRIVPWILLLFGAALAGTQTSEIATLPGDSVGPDPRRERTGGAGRARAASTAETLRVADRWLVELESPPLADGGAAADLERERELLQSEAARAGLRLEALLDYRTLWNGLSVRIDAIRLAALSRLPGVRAVYPVTLIELPPLPAKADVGPTLNDSVSWIGADVARQELGLTGAGIRVGVIDSGIDYRHPDLGGCYGPGCRVAVGYDFLDFDDEPYAGVDSYHGTHVAGIVGARGTITGVAPGVTFGDYRVCRGGCPTDAILAALERALADGMDVVNLSLGAIVPWSRDPLSLAADRLVRQGVVVVAAAGNAGGLGIFAGSTPAAGEHVISVASVGVRAIATPTLAAGGRTLRRTNVAGVPFAPSSGEDRLVFCGRACNGDPLAADPVGRVALVERGGCPIAEKARRVIAAGATVVVVHDDRPGMAFATSLLNAGITSAVTTISQDDGSFLRSLEAPVSVQWGEEARKTPQISEFSSFGPNADLVLKPDIAAPGEAILSTLPLEIDLGLGPGYGHLSGTSMATPHVTGAVALLLEALPHTPAPAVREILMNTADPFALRLAPTLGLGEVPHRQGAGMLDVPGAVRTKTRVDPPTLAAGESEHGPVTFTLQITNKGETDEVYDIAHEPAAGTSGGLWQQPWYWFSNEQLATPATGIAVGAGATVSVGLTLTPALDPQLPFASDLYGGHVAFVPRDGGETVRIPYLGFVGDYQEIEPLDYGLILRPRLDHEVYLVPADAVLAGVALKHPARTVLVDLLDPQTGRNLHRVAREDWVGLSAVAVFDGTTRNAGDNQTYEIPDGEYVMRFSILRPLGDEDNPGHWTEWVTPTFRIGRGEFPANDRCADATPIAGAGRFDFNNTFAATDGVPDPRCSQFGDPQVHGDVWYAWTSTCTGAVTVTTCGLTDVDTKIAVYDGMACPAGQGILACNDDGPADCDPGPYDFQSTVEFEALAGRSYLIRIGKYGVRALGGTGSFAITACGPSTRSGGRDTGRAGPASRPVASPASDCRTIRSIHGVDPR